jgi:hypothetical protein
LQGKKAEEVGRGSYYGDEGEGYTEGIEHKGKYVKEYSVLELLNYLIFMIIVDGKRGENCDEKSVIENLEGDGCGLLQGAIPSSVCETEVNQSLAIIAFKLVELGAKCKRDKAEEAKVKNKWLLERPDRLSRCT